MSYYLVCRTGWWCRTGWLYEYAARRARVELMIELRPSTCFGRVHEGASTKFIRILGHVRRLNSRGGYCSWEPSGWAVEASFGGGERSEGVWEAVDRFSFVRV